MTTIPNNLTRLTDATEIIDAAAVCLCEDGQTVEDVLDRDFLLQLRTAIVDELKARDEAIATARAEGIAQGEAEMRERCAIWTETKYDSTPANIAKSIRRLPLTTDATARDESTLQYAAGWCPECRLWSDNQGFGLTDESTCDHCGGALTSPGELLEECKVLISEMSKLLTWIRTTGIPSPPGNTQDAAGALLKRLP
jgi:hypothetical protein